MKIIATLLAAFVLSSAQSVNASNANSAETNSSVKKEIRSNLSLSTEHSEKVKVRFVVNQHGKTEQVIAITKNPKLKKEIEQSFQLMNFQFLEAEKTYCILLDIVAK